jgi:thiamine biosynthesis protein ThiS
MKIELNNEPVELNDDTKTVAELLNDRGVKGGGTAVSVNNRIVRHGDWENTQLHDGDRVVVISAAFGG